MSRLMKPFELLLRCGLRTPAVRVREKPIESSERQEQSAKAE